MNSTNVTPLKKNKNHIVHRCSSPSCDRPGTIGVTTGNPLCQSHYRRKMRGRPIETPIRPKDNDLVEMPGCRVPSEVAKIMEIAAKARHISVYELQRKINEDWASALLGRLV